VNFADVTALGVTLAQSAVSAFGSAGGVGALNIHSERPLVSKDLASKIRPGVTFRVQTLRNRRQLYLLAQHRQERKLPI